MWIVVAIISYVLLAFAAVGDKYLLAGPLPNPKTYSFYLGMSRSVVFLLVPFGLVVIPRTPVILLALVAGMMQVFALFVLFSGFRKFEVSRIVPALGGAVPVCTAALTFLFGGGREIFSGGNLLAFLCLVGGTLLVSVERQTFLTIQSIRYSLLAALLFSMFFVFSKFVFLEQPFLSGLFWLSMGSLFTSFLFLGAKEVREKVFGFFSKRSIEQQRGKSFSRKTALIFLANQAIGGTGGVLQNFAVALAPFGLLAFVNAIAGVQYVFLFLLTVILSWKVPKVLREKLSSPILIQKIVSIIIIGIGLALLAL